jgi:collagenase-like PrtC family protease
MRIPLIFSYAKEDVDDFEQEERIRQWLASQKSGPSGFVFAYTSRKGNARHARVRASFSLDQKVFEDGKGTYQDIVAGSDGRDLLDREDIESAVEPKTLMLANLNALKIEGELAEWVVQTLKSWIQKNERLFQTLAIDSEW